MSATKPYPVPVIIAIDGPSGAGKSTVSIKVAQALGFSYLDTGAIYRAIAAHGGVGGVLQISTSAQWASVSIDGTDLTEEIRTPEITAKVSQFAADPEVRRYATDLIRSLMSGNFVVEGRDIGTVVAPEAELKIYLTADESSRAQRRAGDWQGDTQTASQSNASRDQVDSSRSVAPLRQAEDAIVIDSTSKTIDEVVELILTLAKERL